MGAHQRRLAASALLHESAVYRNIPQSDPSVPFMAVIVRVFEPEEQRKSNSIGPTRHHAAIASRYIPRKPRGPARPAVDRRGFVFLLLFYLCLRDPQQFPLQLHGPALTVDKKEKGNIRSAKAQIKQNQTACHAAARTPA
jgi:hypothetical protein